MVISRTVQAPLQRVLDELHSEFAAVDEGGVATYIPELSRADPGWFGISLVTLDGYEYAAGDSHLAFTIQSIAKPFVYGLALESAGEEQVLAKVGLEPTGDAFNAISLDPASGAPSNPMINAGAIATTGIVLQETGADAFGSLMSAFGRYLGRDVQIDERVYASERDTGHRNRAISHLLRGFEIVANSPEDALDLYFKQCSVLVTCRDLALMAACLANNGINPQTGERALEGRYVESVLSAMGSCGMYDYAGEWIYRVGMPAKSGVAGGLLAVLPGQLGIGVFSPRLDERGNSVRGVGVCASLSTTFGLHMFSVPNMSLSVVRATYDGSSVRSKRQRPISAVAMLADEGERLRGYELQGDVAFAAAEAFSRDVVTKAEACDLITIDFRRVECIERGALAILVELFSGLLDASKQIVFSDVAHLPEFAAQLVALGAASEGVSIFPDRDRALEWCEDWLIESQLGPTTSNTSVSLADNELCQGLDEGALERLHSVLTYGRASAGNRIVSAGDNGGSILLLTRGDVSIKVDLPSGKDIRIATLSAGMALGELSVLGEAVRTANVVADGDVEFCELSVGDFNRLADSAPDVRAVIVENLARKLAERLRQANAELQALSA